MSDSFSEIRAEAESIVADKNLDAGAKRVRLRGLESGLRSTLGVVQGYLGDQGLVQEAELGDSARKLLVMRANADEHDRLVEQGHSPADLAEQGYVTHAQLDQLGEEGLLAEAVEQWPGGEPAE